MTDRAWQPILMVVSAPSGAGKTTLCDRLAAEFAKVTYSISCTTRKPRLGEIDGTNYHFLTGEEFAARRERGAFLESACVHGYWYGTLREEVLEALSRGHDVLMDLDVQGAQSVRDYVRQAGVRDPLKRRHVDVFIAPPSIEDLKRRLRGRGQDDAEVIRRRLERAEAERRHAHEFDYLILNDRLDDSYDALRSVFLAEHHRTAGKGEEHA